MLAFTRHRQPWERKPAGGDQNLRQQIKPARLPLLFQNGVNPLVLVQQIIEMMNQISALSI
jgi:hypothetical protein